MVVQHKCGGRVPTGLCGVATESASLEAAVTAAEAAAVSAASASAVMTCINKMEEELARMQGAATEEIGIRDSQIEALTTAHDTQISRLSAATRLLDSAIRERNGARELCSGLRHDLVSMAHQHTEEVERVHANHGEIWSAEVLAMELQISTLATETEAAKAAAKAAATEAEAARAMAKAAVAEVELARRTVERERRHRLAAVAGAVAEAERAQVARRAAVALAEQACADLDQACADRRAAYAERDQACAERETAVQESVAGRVTHGAVARALLYHACDNADEERAMAVADHMAHHIAHHSVRVDAQTATARTLPAPSSPAETASRTPDLTPEQTPEALCEELRASQAALQQPPEQGAHALDGTATAGQSGCPHLGLGLVAELGDGSQPGTLRLTPDSPDPAPRIVGATLDHQKLLALHNETASEIALHNETAPEIAGLVAPTTAERQRTRQRWRGIGDSNLSGGEAEPDPDCGSLVQAACDETCNGGRRLSHDFCKVAVGTRLAAEGEATSMAAAAAAAASNPTAGLPWWEWDALLTRLRQLVTCTL